MGLRKEKNMVEEKRRWRVTYDHEDGRSGVVEVETELQQSGGFQYGNGKAGGITVDGCETRFYDLRYEHGDLHRLMLDDYFGNGLVKAEAI